MSEEGEFFLSDDQIKTQTRLLELENMVNELEGKNSQLSTENSRLQSEVEVLQKSQGDNQESIEENKTLRVELAQIKADYSELENKSKRKYNLLLQENETLQEKVTKLEPVGDGQDSSNEEYKSKIKHLETELETQTTNIGFYQKSLNEWKTKYYKLEEQKSKLGENNGMKDTSEDEKLRNENEKLHKKIEELEDRLREKNVDSGTLEYKEEGNFVDIGKWTEINERNALLSRDIDYVVAERDRILHQLQRKTKEYENVSKKLKEKTKDIQTSSQWKEMVETLKKKLERK